MKAMHSIAKVTGKSVATAFDLSSYKVACDLGGKRKVQRITFGWWMNNVCLNNKPILLIVCFSPQGCTGAMAYEFTKAHPGLSVTVFDLPAVVEMSEHFHPLDTDNRVSFVAGTFARQHQKHCFHRSCLCFTCFTRCFLNRRLLWRWAAQSRLVHPGENSSRLARWEGARSAGENRECMHTR